MTREQVVENLELYRAYAARFQKGGYPRLAHRMHKRYWAWTRKLRELEKE